MNRTQLNRICSLAIASAIVLASAQLNAQFKTEIINSQGAEAPCVGIGPVGAPIAKKCVDAFLLAGFVRADVLGVTGLTIGTTGAADGIVTKVDPGSPAASAGISVGDAIVAVDGKSTHVGPADAFAQLSFGKAGDTLHLIITRGGATQNVNITRTQIGAPAQPAWPHGFMFYFRPLINWRGQFVPCVGSGPAGAAAIEFCDKRFMPFGYVKINEIGATGIHIDPANNHKAIVASVDQGSAAAVAGVKPGDEITAIEGKAVAVSAGETAQELLFGKAAEQRAVTLHNATGNKTITLTLATKP